jgi:hypothetical protein
MKPILLYGSEVWGIFNVTSVKLSRTDDIHLNDCYKKAKKVFSQFKEDF